MGDVEHDGQIPPTLTRSHCHSSQTEPMNSPLIGEIQRLTASLPTTMRQGRKHAPPSARTPSPSGTINGLRFTGSGDCDKLLNVACRGASQVCEQRRLLPIRSQHDVDGDQCANLSETTDLSCMFREAKVVDGDLSNWATTGATDISYVVLSPRPSTVRSATGTRRQ